jgi:hypothetical protein
MVLVKPESITYTPSTGDSEEEYNKRFNKSSTVSKPFVVDMEENEKEIYSEIHINSTTMVGDGPVKRNAIIVVGDNPSDEVKNIAEKIKEHMNTTQ